jgi:hypothetical protein
MFLCQRVCFERYETVCNSFFFPYSKNIQIIQIKKAATKSENEGIRLKTPLFYSSSLDSLNRFDCQTFLSTG